LPGLTAPPPLAWRAALEAGVLLHKVSRKTAKADARTVFLTADPATNGDVLVLEHVGFRKKRHTFPISALRLVLYMPSWAEMEQPNPRVVSLFFQDDAITLVFPAAVDARRFVAILTFSASPRLIYRSELALRWDLVRKNFLHKSRAAGGTAGLLSSLLFADAALAADAITNDALVEGSEDLEPATDASIAASPLDSEVVISEPIGAPEASILSL
jgi:hypothetical protein